MNLVRDSDLVRDSTYSVSLNMPKSVATVQTKKTWIWVTFQKIGYHAYPAAATEPTLADVSYLGQRHRHLFKVRVQIEVFHTERELEFHQALNWIMSLYDAGTLEFNAKSCETISDELAFEIQNKYPRRDVNIEVSEDGECGSFVEYGKVQNY